MTFNFTGAMIGPFCAALGRGKAGENQRFRCRSESYVEDHLAYAQIVTEGRMVAVWNSDESAAIEFGEGGSFYFDSPTAGLLAANDEMTIIAKTDSSYLCVVATGTEQKIDLKRRQLAPGDKMMVERFSLLATAGQDSAIRVNGGDIKRGLQLVYAKTSDIVIEAVSPSMVAVFSMRG